MIFRYVDEVWAPSQFIADAVRKETDKNSTRITQIKKAGTQVTLLGEATDGDGMRWYYVRTANGKEGYVREDMLKVDP